VTPRRRTTFAQVRSAGTSRKTWATAATIALTRAGLARMRYSPIPPVADRTRPARCRRWNRDPSRTLGSPGGGMTRRRLQQKDGERIRLFGRAAEIHIRMVSPASWSLNNSGMMPLAIFSNASHSRENVVTESADRRATPVLPRRRRSSLVIFVQVVGSRAGRTARTDTAAAREVSNERDRTGGGHGQRRCRGCTGCRRS
jgi:hypothetical protein